MELQEKSRILEWVFFEDFQPVLDELQPDLTPRMTHYMPQQISNASSNRLSLYPNPNNGQFVLEYYPNTDAKVVLFAVIDMTGKQVYSQSINLNAGAKINFDLPIATGVYNGILLDENDFKYVTRIAIQR